MTIKASEVLLAERLVMAMHLSRSQPGCEQSECLLALVIRGSAHGSFLVR